MAKQKTKMGPIGTTCIEVRAGVWRFATGKFHWEFGGGAGINLFCAPADSEGFTGQLFARTLTEAIHFAHGFESGATLQDRIDASKRSTKYAREKADAKAVGQEY